MSKLTRSLAIGALGATLLFGTVACGDDAGDEAAEEIIEENLGGDVDIDSDAGTVEVANDDGTLTSGRNELPKDWPEDVAFPDGYTIVFTSTTGDEEMGITTNVVAEAKDSPEDVIAAFEDAMDDSWKVTDQLDMSGEGSSSLSVGFEKDGRSVAVAAIGGPDSSTQISVNHRTAH